MKRFLIPLLVLALLCAGLSAHAEEDAITLELNTTRLPLYAAGDPYLSGLTEQTDLPVLVLPVKKSWQLSVKVQPQKVRNKQFSLSVDNDQVVRVKKNTVTGLTPGETVLTIASAQDPNVTIQYRVVVVQPITRITLTASAKSVAAGSTMSLSPVIVPDNATKQQVTWASANESILTVDENGVVTGVKKGNGRVTATAADGSNVRVNINIPVTQGANEITLDHSEVTVDVGRTALLKATVLPKDTNNKKVAWSSSDASIASVNAQGRITGISLGDCEIICTSQDNGDVQAKATVHVQQPVKKVTFGAAPAVYVGESAQLTWTIEPDNATNPALKFTSSNPKVLAVEDDGTVTGISVGEAAVIAKTTDGSNRQAKLKVKVMQHVTGVHFLRHTAYIDLGESNGAGVEIEPKKFTNHNMIWETADDSVASVAPDRKTPTKVTITGNREGTTTVTGITEDGGLRTNIEVKVGNWNSALHFDSASANGRGNFRFRVTNESDLTITRVVIEVKCFEDDGTEALVNRNDAGNTCRFTCTRTLTPGMTCGETDFKSSSYDNGIAWDIAKCRIIMFVIDNDWEKWIPGKMQQTKQIRLR